MATLLLTFTLFLLAMAGLAVGVALGRRPIAGSCGGLACSDSQGCGTCGRGNAP